MACEFDRESSYAFVADYSGKINILHLKQDGYTHMTTLQGHQSKGRGWWEGGVSAGGLSLGCVWCRQHTSSELGPGKADVVLWRL